MGKADDHVVNTLTGERIPRPKPLEEEVPFDGGVMITETDLRGIITYANRKFCEMTGYSRSELVGSPHSLIRHPDMPEAAFKGMWETIRAGKIWRGYVKNIRKDGRYYWVLVYIQPKLDENGKMVGYIAGRKVAFPEEVARVENLYRMLKEEKLADHEIFRSQYDELLRAGAKRDHVG
jgi:PAS domain S-box-containing protein